MATLFNTKISATYEGLFKTIDNAAITASLKELTDGSGNQSGLYVNNAGDFKVSNILEWGSLKDTGTGVTITRYVTSTDGIENFDNNTSLPTSAAVKLYVDSKFATSDTLQEVLSFGNTTGGNDIVVSASDDITFTDTSKILMGASSDLQIYHDGSNSYIDETGSGDLYIKSSQLFLQSTTGENLMFAQENSGVFIYFNNSKKLETTNTGVDVTGNLVVSGTITGSGGSFLPLAGGTMTGNIVLNDNVKSIYGTSNDGLEVYHDGTHSYIKDTGTGDLKLQASNDIFLLDGSGNVMIEASEGGSVDLFYSGNKKLATTNTGVDITGTLSTTSNVSVGANATFVDNGKALFGAGSDLQIYHDGSISKIIELTSELQISSAGSNLYIQSITGENAIKLIPNGSVELYYDNAKKFETLTDGAKVTGNLEVTGTITGSGGSFLPLAGGTMTGDTLHGDNVKSIYGAGSDLEIYHDGSNSRIVDNGTGELRLQGTNLRLWASNGENYLTAIEGGSVSLYYSASKKFETTNIGVQVSGSIEAVGGSIFVYDGNEFRAGDAGDLRIGHDATNSYLKNNTGDLYINQAAVTKSILFKVSDANALDTTALTISRNADASFGRDVTIAGDLTVNGTTTTINTEHFNVEDPLISMAKDNAANSVDIGFYGKYNDGTARYLGLFSDASDSNKFKLFKGLTTEPTTTVDIGGTGYEAASLVVDSLNSNNIYNSEYIYHSNDTDTFIRFLDNRIIQQAGAGNSKIDFHDNGQLYLYSGGSSTLVLDTNQNASFAGNVSLGDDKELIFGAASDYKIYHNSTTNVNHITSFIDRQLSINANNIFLTNQANNSTFLLLNSTGATFAGNVAINGNATLGDGTADNHIINGQVTHLTADALGYKLHRTAGGTSILISATGDAELEFGTDNGSGTNTTQWTIGKDGTDNSFRISNSASLGTSDALAIDSSGNSTFYGRNVIENTTNLTTGVVDTLLIKTLSSGASITNGFGSAISFYLENTVYSAVNEVAKISVIETDTTAINDKMVFLVKDNNILAERLTLNGSGATFTGDINISAGKKLQYSANSFITPENNVTGAEISTAGDFRVKTGSTPTLALTIGGTQDSTFAGSITGTSAQFIDTSNPDANSGSVIIEGRRDGSANLLTLRAKDASNPSSALPDGQGGLVRFQGFDGTDFENMAYIQVAADGQAVANGDSPSFMAFGTSTDGSSSPTEKMRIDSSGNVGIGTDTPSALLEIQTAGTTGSQDFQIFSRGESPNYEVFKISRAAGSTELLANQNLTLSADYDANHTSVDSNIIFKTDNTERMRITSGGDITVSGGDIFLNSGTSYNDKGVVYLSNERTAIISDIVNGTANGDTSLDFQTRSAGTRASALFIDEFRKIGINTNDPSSMLQVNQSANDRTGGIYTKINGGGYGLSMFVNSGGYGIIGGNGQFANDIQTMDFNSAYLGIGVTPTNKLVVRDNDSGGHTTNNYVDSTATFVSTEWDDNNYHSIAQLVAVRQSLTTGKDANGYLGFSTIDDSNNQGMKDAARIAIKNITGSARNSGVALSFWTNPGGTTDTVAAVQRVYIGADGIMEKNGDSSSARIIPASDNVGYLGEANHRWQAVYAVNGSIQTSDIREKTEIKPTTLGLNFINDLNPVSYKWIDNERIDGNKDERNHQGLIAQEIAEVLEKHGVYKNEFGGLDIQKTDKYDDFHGMSYEQLIAPMIKAIQELKAEVDSLKQECKCKN